MNIVTPPKKDLKTRHYSKDMNMDNNVATLPKKGLKTRHYNKDMNMDNNVATLPKKGLKTRPYNIGMAKRDLKKYDYTVYMDMDNHEHLLDNDPFKDEVAQEPARRIKPPKPTRKPPPPPIPQVEDHIINVPVPKIKELNRALNPISTGGGVFHPMPSKWLRTPQRKKLAP